MSAPPAEDPPGPPMPAGKPASSPGRDRLTAAAVLLPALALALPGPAALLGGDPQAELTGAGWAALFTVPLAVLLSVGRAAPRPRGLFLLLGFLAAGALSLAVYPPVDTLAADRAVALALTGLVAFLGGAALRTAGRVLFARGLAAVAVLAAGGALLFPGAGGEIAGPLQNTGATSELALLGAACGAWLFARDRSRSPGWRWLGAAAVLAEAFYAGRAPVLAAPVALAAVLPLGAVLSPGRGDRRRLAAIGGLALAALLAGWYARPDSAPGAVGGPAAASGAADDLAGAEVRARIWSRSLVLVRDHPLLGAGPGQFEAAFPPYRDPREQRASDAAARLAAGAAGAQSEVEHAHSDWLQGALEVGLVGGALWIALLLLAAVRASGALRGDPPAAALAAAALVLLVNGLVREPLLRNPAAAPVGFALLGAALASPRPARGASARLGRGAVLVGTVLLVLTVGEARSLVAHGRALTAALAARTPGDAAAHLRAALAARPDSVPALAAAARATERGDPRDAAAAWEAVLARRPHHFEALVQSAGALARTDELDTAHRRWRYALGLAPGDAGVLNNLMHSAALAGDVDEALAWHAQAGFETDRVAVLAFAVLQERADAESARRLFDAAGPPWAELSAQGAHDLAQRLEDEGQVDRARVLAGHAQLVWARQHVAQGDPASAVRSYRQALSGLSVSTPDGHRAPAGLRYELAAALALAGRPDEARTELPPPPHDARVLRELPPWVGDALLPLFAGG